MDETSDGGTYYSTAVGPYKLLVGNASSSAFADKDTNEILKFESIADIVEATKLLGYNYWKSGLPRPDNCAYEQLWAHPY